MSRDSLVFRGLMKRIGSMTFTGVEGDDVPLKFVMNDVVVLTSLYIRRDILLSGKESLRILGVGNETVGCILVKAVGEMCEGQNRVR